MPAAISPKEITPPIIEGKPVLILHGSSFQFHPVSHHSNASIVKNLRIRTKGGTYCAYMTLVHLNFTLCAVWSKYGVVIKPDLTQCIHNAAL